MTVATPGGSEVQQYAGDYGNLGLEDVTISDISAPRLSIVGPSATFKHSASGVEYQAVNVILLAQVKQRVMWHKDQNDNYKMPQCKSPDFKTGFPNVDPKAPQGYDFPWASGVFDEAAGREGRYLPQVKEESGQPALPCESCNFKEWVDKKTACKEQHTYPLLMQEQDGSWSPAILTIQGSGIKNSRLYVQTFATKRLPLFSAITQLTLTPATRGAVHYAIPNFAKIGETDGAEWDEYAMQTRSMQDYLRAFPRPRDESDSAPAAAAQNVNVPPPAQMVPPPAQVAPPAAPPVAHPVIEHEPQPDPAPVAPPVQAPPAAPPAPAAVASPPPPAPAAAPAPPPAPAAPAPAAAVPPPPAPSAAAVPPPPAPVSQAPAVPAPAAAAVPPPAAAPATAPGEELPF